MITINARGARTLNDVTALVYGGHKVYVTFDNGTAQLHLGGSIVAERPAAEVETILAAQDWAYEVIETAAEIVTETVTTEAHEAAAQQVRTNAATALAEAERLDVRATVTASRPSKAERRNPRHPLNQAARIQAQANHLRGEAQVLAAWTAQDEARYSGYVSEGLAATDGHYAPLTRVAWKRTIGA